MATVALGKFRGSQACRWRVHADGLDPFFFRDGMVAQPTREVAAASRPPAVTLLPSSGVEFATKQLVIDGDLVKCQVCWGQAGAPRCAWRSWQPALFPANSRAAPAASSGVS